MNGVKSELDLLILKAQEGGAGSENCAELKSLRQGISDSFDIPEGFSTRCLPCLRLRLAEEPQLRLDVGVKEGSIADLLRERASSGFDCCLEGNNQYNCCKDADGGCGCSTDAVRFYIGPKRLPNSVVLQLKRFDGDDATEALRAANASSETAILKSAASVSFAESLDAYFVTGSCDMFDLSTAVIHDGKTMNHGHYFVVSKIEGQWWVLSDASPATKIDATSLREYFGGSAGHAFRI
jgi:ubiquitin C-terminal hydrolase